MEAFGNLVRKYQDRLFNSMVHQLRNESVAEDVVQEAFMAAFNRLETFQGKKLIRASHQSVTNPKMSAYRLFFQILPLAARNWPSITRAFLAWTRGWRDWSPC